MSGLSGYITPKKRGETLKSIGRSMRNALIDRGPDGVGEWQKSLNDVQVYLGYTRLAVLDLTNQGNQPMESKSERYSVVYNGEVYNYVSLREELQARGVTFNGRSDSEVVVAAIDVWGLNAALQKFQGMFALVVWDNHKNEIHFARDMFGQKPLYIGWADQDLIFASDIRAFVEHPDFAKEISPQGFSNYMHFGHVQAPLSIFKDVLSLPAGFRLSLSLNQIVEKADLEKLMRNFWNVKEQLLETRALHEPDYGHKHYLDALEQELKLSVNRCMVSDVPMGVLLTGGISDSVLAAMAQEFSSRSIDTYDVSISGNSKKRASDKIAKHLSTHHNKLTLSYLDVADSIAEIGANLGEPYADEESVLFNILCKHVRSRSTIALSDIGSNVLFGGYNRHVIAPKLWRQFKYMPLFLRKAFVGLPQDLVTRLTATDNYEIKAEKLKSALYARNAKEFYEHLLEQDPAVSSVLSKDFDYFSKARGLISRDDWQIENIPAFVDQIMYWDMLSYLPNASLTATDRFSNNYSLEIRAPYLDAKIFEFAASLPQKYKIRGNQGKAILKDLYDRYIPDNIQPSQKLEISLARLFRKELKGFVEDILKNLDSTLFDSEEVQKIWSAHKSKKEDHAHLLWRIVMFQMWSKKML